MDLGDYRFGQPGTLSVDFQLPSGAFAARPQAIDVFDHNHLKFAEADLQEGRLREFPITAGSYFLQLRGKGSSSKAIPFEITGGKHTQLNVKLSQGVPCTLSFTFEGQNLHQARYLELTIFDSGGKEFLWERVVHADLSQFRFSRSLAPGRYSIAAACFGGATATGNFQVPARTDQVTDFPFVLR